MCLDLMGIPRSQTHALNSRTRRNRMWSRRRVPRRRSCHCWLGHSKWVLRSSNLSWWNLHGSLRKGYFLSGLYSWISLIPLRRHWMNNLLAFSLRCSPIAHRSSPHWEVNQRTCTIQGRWRSKWRPRSFHDHHEQGRRQGRRSQFDAIKTTHKTSKSTTQHATSPDSKVNHHNARRRDYLEASQKDQFTEHLTGKNHKCTTQKSIFWKTTWTPASTEDQKKWKSRAALLSVLQSIVKWWE